ncbi:MAG: type IX secretion system sortase PorU [Bacteroidia bacterium]|nr:type IX secretion system sortase PorU [Bacteroidia bacterium]
MFRNYLVLTVFIFCGFISGKSQTISRTLIWEDYKTYHFSKTVSANILYFENCAPDVSKNNMPFYSERFELASSQPLNFELSNAVYADLVVPAGVTMWDSIGFDIKPQTTITTYKKQSAAWVSFLPIRKNQTTGRYEKLISFTLTSVVSGLKGSANTMAHRVYAAESVLASGKWYKIGVTNDGVYQLNYNFLKNTLGIADIDKLNPQNLRIYGNGGGMVPMLNSIWRPDDLLENAILVSGEGDGVFNNNDFVLFYGQGPDRWSLRADQNFYHEKHDYCDTTYYFITFDKGTGKRIGNIPNLQTTPTVTVNTFNDYLFYEVDKYNLIKSGRTWYGNPFDVQPTQDFSFNFSNVVAGSQAFLKIDVAGRSFKGGANGSSIKVTYNGGQLLDTKIASVLDDFTQPYCAVPVVGTSTSFAPTSSNIDLRFSFSAIYQPANAWLNYIDLNVKRNLVFTGNEIAFREKTTVAPGNTALFELGNMPTSSYYLWDVTTPWDVKNQGHNNTGGLVTFTAQSDTLHQYFAFNSNAYKNATAFGQVANQNLHGISQVNMLIVTTPAYLAEANRLAEFHRNFDTLSVAVVTDVQVFNEFSSGAADVSAIRDFCKMFYDRAANNAEMPHYLLLFGDGTYDNKYILYKANNYIVSYQSENSCSPTASYCSDDFFGLLDDNEGLWTTTEEPDMGIGRIPANNVEEAQMVVDKIINYQSLPGKIVDETACNTDATTMGDWRNTLCFIADDQDGVLHVNSADKLANKAKAKAPVYNIDKIYLDGFQQVSTPGGQRYPAVKDAINKRVEKGALLLNYTGHGGELGWTEERVLEIADIRSWKNKAKLPVFITATCEFSRYDDPSRTSAGELCLVNSSAGAVALFTTTRLAYSFTNENINAAMIDSMFSLKNGKYPRLGDIFSAAKRQTSNDPGQRNFALLGDPAVQMVYPKLKVAATQLNGQNINTATDTLKALGTVTIKGEVQDAAGNKLSNYNGIVYPTVYDKMDSLKTLRNDSTGNNQSGNFNYQIQKNILYKGKVSVTNGAFEFTFIVPKDIKYNTGHGRISFYVQNGFEDGSGFNTNIKIGGINTSAVADKLGPEVKLYLNNEKFVFGGLTNNNPVVYALVADSSGINTVGNGIGHDITVTVNDDANKIFNVNDYYQSNLNSYSSGKVIYPLELLPPGRHALKIKVWDIHNNSSDAYTEFTVAESAGMVIDRVLNYPNPFTTNTRFFFEHNLTCQTLLVDIKIFTLSGKLIKNLSQYVDCQGYRLDGIAWDGRDDFGDPIGKGVYIYKLKVTSAEGQSADKIEKLVILR